jgi:hypothetical protein
LCGGKFEKALQKQDPLNNFLFTYKLKKETIGLGKRRVDCTRAVQNAKRETLRWKRMLTFKNCGSGRLWKSQAEKKAEIFQ